MCKETLDLYTDYLISQNGYATATGLSRLLDGQISHDKVTRCLAQAEQGSKELWSYAKSGVRESENDDGALILDDTIEEKPYTDENEIVCWHHSHTKGHHVKGMNILTSLVRYEDIAFPIGYEIVKKDQKFRDEKTQKEKRRASISKNALFEKLVCQAVRNDVKFKWVLADSWYGTTGNMSFIHYELKKCFIFGMKSNRHVSLTPAGQKRGKFQTVESLDLENGKCKVVYLKGMTLPVQLLKKVFTNKDNSTGTLYLVSNDLTLDADRLYDVYKRRWRIEEFHKSIKQNASLAKSPTKIERTQGNHVFASMIAYCKLEFLKIKTTLNHFALKHKLLLRANMAAMAELRTLTAHAGASA